MNISKSTLSRAALPIVALGLYYSAVVWTETAADKAAELANQPWSFAGARNRDDFSETFVNPPCLIRFQASQSWWINTKSTDNRKSESWSTPINFTVT